MVAAIFAFHIHKTPLLAVGFYVYGALGWGD